MLGTTTRTRRKDGIVLKKNGLLPGPSARAYLIAAYVAGLVFVGVMVVSGTHMLMYGLTYTAAAHPIVVNTLFVTVVVSILVAATCFQLGMGQLKRELEYGYTTIPGDFRSVELRDPRNGRVLRAKGTPGGKRLLSVSLRRWRERKTTHTR